VVECKKLSYDPLCIGLFKDDYFMLGSNSNEFNFYTKDGIYVNSINEGINDWVLQVRPSNKHNSIIVCTNNGKVLNYQITFLVVHGIHNEKYVYRQNLMDVMINNLMTGNKTKIKCKKYVRKLAVYKNLVAALTTDKVCIYELNEDETAKTPKYYVKWEGDLNLILLTSNHLLVCLDNRLLLFCLTSNTGSVEREWTFEADIKYLRVLGGAEKKEALIGGLKSGEIYMIYIDNQFPVLIYQHDIPIRSLDVSCDRKRLAVVDENHDIFVIEIATKNVIWKNEKAKSASFNSDIEDMIAYWYDGNVYIKTGDFAPTYEKMNGVIVGFRGTKVYLLQAMNNINVLDISHSSSIMKYSDTKNFEESYKVACMGATKQEWLYLGFESLLDFKLNVAISCFKKLQDIRLINLCFRIEKDLRDRVNKDVLTGDILAHMGRFKEAADYYIKAEDYERAIQMYTDLKDYNKASEIKNKYLKQDVQTAKSDQLLVGQADWLYENGKKLEAADLYWTLGKKKRAIEVYGELGMLDKLIQFCRELNKEDNYDLIAYCGQIFKKHKHYQYATEAYLKLGDLKALVMMNVELGRFEEAFLLAQQNKALLEYVYLQYAEKLISEDRFKEAQIAYKKAGRIDLSMRLLDKLIDNASYEKRYKDACQLLFSYAADAITVIEDYSGATKQEVARVRDYKEAYELAGIFNAFDIIYKYVDEPFSSDLLNIDSQGLFNTSKYLANKITNMKTKSRFLSKVWDCINI
jgi:intraflagellar transport protein 122